MIIPGIRSTIDLDENPMVQALHRGASATNDFKGDAEKNLTEAGTNGARGFLKGLNSELGKRSLLGQGLKLALGGGAIAGVGLATNVLEGVTSSISKLSDGMRNGGADVGSAFIRELPIVGNLAKSFDNLSEAIYGTHAAEEQLQRTQDTFNASFEKRRQLMNDLKAGTIAYTAELAHLQRALAVAQVPSDQRESAQLSASYFDAKAKRDNDYELQAKLIGEDGKPGEYGTTRDALEMARAEVDRLKKTRDAIAADMENRKKNFVGAPGPLVGGDGPESQRTKLEDTSRQVDAAEEKVEKLRSAFEGLEKNRTSLLNLKTLVDVTAYQTLLIQENEASDKLNAKFKESADKSKQTIASVLQSWRSTVGGQLDKMLPGAVPDQLRLHSLFSPEKFDTPLDRTKARIHDLNDAFKSGLIDQQKYNFGLRDSLAQFDTPLDRVMERVNDLKDAFKGGLINDTQYKFGLRDSLDATRSALQFEALPNPRVQAEEVFGPRTVTSADVPQPFVEMLGVDKEHLKTSQDILTEIQKLVNNSGQATTINSPVVNF